jgi:hypothetical protein
MCATIRSSLVILILIGGFVCAAQDGQIQTEQTATANQSGSLSGFVYCADTNLPARLAEVNLVRYSESSYDSRIFAKTDLEGRFNLKQIPEGEYYLATVLPGYMDLLSHLTKAHLDAMTAEERKKMLALTPKVTISAGQPAHVSIRIERSAEIIGTVLYDDGSPAAGLVVSYAPVVPGTAAKDVEGWSTSGIPNTFSGPPLTDDRGRFRILGVSAGEYLVRVTVPMPLKQYEGAMRYVSGIQNSLYLYNGLNVYAGGALRASKAKKIKVTAGGGSIDADITIPLSTLHTVRGHVLLKNSGEPAVFANLRLLYADTREELRSSFATDGDFEIHYVPEGNYLLRGAAGMAPPNPDDFEGQRFHQITWAYPRAGNKSPEVPLKVNGDLENVTITVPMPAATDEKEPPIYLMVGTESPADSSGSQH